jgi:peptidase E
MCWFESGITKGMGRPRAAPGLGFLPGSNSVHYDGEPDRRPAFLEAVASGALPAGYGVQDNVGLLFRGTRLAEVVASREGLRAYRVDAVQGTPREHELEPRVLAGREHKPPGAVPHDIGELRLLRAARRRMAQD